MLELAIPNIIGIITETIKKDSGTDINLKLEQTTGDYQIFVNPESGSRYLVQTATRFDLFGQLCYNKEYPQTDIYVYIGPRFIFFHFASRIGDYWKDSVVKDASIMKPDLDKSYCWTSAFDMFDQTGGIIYDWKEWILVDRSME